MTNLDLSKINNFNIKVYTDSLNCEEGVLTPVQIHGPNIIEVVSGDENLNNCDALLTSNSKFKLGIKTADCASVCLGDGERIGIIHIGWRGLVSGVYEKAEKLFKKENLEVFVGPFLRSFEIQKDFCFDQIFAKFGDRFFVYKGDKIIFDFKSALQSILPLNTFFDVRDTKSDLSLPSNRRDNTTKRLLTVISFK